MFDIVNYYPSITEPLLLEALNFASKFTTISNEDINLFKLAKNYLLFHCKARFNFKSNYTKCYINPLLNIEFVGMSINEKAYMIR